MLILLTVRVQPTDISKVDPIAVVIMVFFVEKGLFITIESSGEGASHPSVVSPDRSNLAESITENENWVIVRNR